MREIPIHRRVGTGGPIGIPAGNIGDRTVVPIPDAAVVCTIYGIGVALDVTWQMSPLVAGVQPQAAPWYRLPGIGGGGTGPNHTSRVTVPCGATAILLTLAGATAAQSWAWVAWET